MEWKIVNANEIESNHIDNELRLLVDISMFCNDTKIGTNKQLLGDPTETALVDMGFNLNFDPSRFDRIPRIGEIPFDSERKLMTTVNKIGDKYFVYTKGGIDELLERCNRYIENGQVKLDRDDFEDEVRNVNNQMAKKL